MLRLCRTPHHPRLTLRLSPLEPILQISLQRFVTSVGNSHLGTGSWNLLETHRQYQPQVVEDPRLCALLWRDCLAKKTKVGKSFSMLLPPPNITGDLHLGHALTATIQDAICRWQHMKGRDVLWIPGMDHAGLATQMVVERHLFGHTCDRQDSMNPRLQMGREAFVQEVWKWKDSKGSSILAQLNRLGLLLDWSREYFTLSPDHNRAVSEALYRLFKDGLLYRSNSLIFWCCHLRSAISDIEVDHKILTEMTRLSVPGYAEPQPFGYVDVFDYQLAPPHQPFVSKSRKPRSTVPVATTRLETMLADTALAVHPSDTRYAHLIGQSVLHPFCNSRHIPIIADDEHVDPNQGTGVVKVSPGHSMVDWEIATRHGLRAINMLADDGTVNFVGGPQFQGLRRFSARQHLVKRLSELGLYRGRFAVGESAEFLAPVGAVSLPVCSRSGDVIEPLLREQWFVNTDPMADAALRAVQTGQLRISPSFHEPTWCDWLAPEKRRHWCISRQVWWGHRMPAYRVPEKSSDLQSTEVFNHLECIPGRTFR
uniref:valine--tRNA ligase n=1 Tax=Schistocephalus solidus TaxID=70667 RepID=A0A0X3Q909_SCHSO